MFKKRSFQPRSFQKSPSFSENAIGVTLHFTLLFRWVTFHFILFGLRFYSFISGFTFYVIHLHLKFTWFFSLIIIIIVDKHKFNSPRASPGPSLLLLQRRTYQGLRWSCGRVKINLGIMLRTALPRKTNIRSYIQKWHFR